MIDAAMPTYVADTHAMLWFWSDPSKLGEQAREIFRDVARGTVQMFLPTISLVEVQIKEDKGRFPAGWTRALRDFVTGTPGLGFAYLDVEVATALAEVPHAAVPDMPDRIIAATALAHGASLLTVDEKITTWAGVKVVW